MNEVVINKKDELVMKLLYYFINIEGYNPIILHGAKDEIWLENFDANYKIVRIVSNYIHNDEQLKFDVFKTKKIVSKIRKKTFTFKSNTLSLLLNLGDSVNIDKVEKSADLDVVEIKNINDFKKYDYVLEVFPDIMKKTSFKEKGLELFTKLTSNINEKGTEDRKKAEEIFTPKKPVVTYILIALNLFMFLAMYVYGYGSTDVNTLVYFGANYAPYIKDGQIIRLITSAFLHYGVIHLLFNMYALYVLGKQLESFIGKYKFLAVYLTSAVAGNLLSCIFLPDTVSVGASGAIFGLFGSLTYFAYNYRAYIGNFLQNQIIPVIAINLVLSLMIGSINFFAHIGGLVGGFIITMALGLKYKEKKVDIINGIMLSLIYIGFLLVMVYK